MKQLIALVAVVLMAVTLIAQQPDPFTLKVDVDLVLFNVTVQDRRGNIVSGLEPVNFRVYEEGTPQDINFFRAEDIPATVGLVIDNSGSMNPKRAEVIEAGLAFARASNPADEVFIINFNDHVSSGLPPSTPFTSDFNRIQRTLRNINAVGRTALYDAVIKSLKYAEDGRHQRKALVVLSDGGDNASMANMDNMLQAIQESNATVFTIGIYDPRAKDKNPDVLKKIARQGGGEAYFPKSGLELTRIWERIAGGIRSQYTLGFTSTNRTTGENYRNVQIRAVGKDGKSLRVRTREGYWAAANQESGVR